MAIIKELEDAIQEILEQSDESEEFKRRLSKLLTTAIENSNHSAYSNEDLKEIIEIINSREEDYS